jgi:myo-inositol 2-dehydrogenase/D-chiro-inositol 1-dehydrogenase
MRRYDHALRTIKAAITNGTIGEPLLGHAVHRNPHVPKDFRSEMVPYDVIVHEFDQFRWLFDQEIVSTTAVRSVAPRSSARPERPPDPAARTGERRGR